MSERCPLRMTDQTQEVSEYFYFTNLYFSMMLQRLSMCSSFFLFFLISSFPSLLLSFLSLFTSCSSLHPCFTCFLHFFLSFSLPSHFLSCALIIFVSLPSLVRASFIPALFEFDFFFLPCTLHLFSQSFRL